MPSEGSFFVEGGSGSAGGAHTSSSSGTWVLDEQEWDPFVRMHYRGGGTEDYCLSNLKSGESWRNLA
jgi:hypothetical protein